MRQNPITPSGKKKYYLVEDDTQHEVCKCKKDKDYDIYIIYNT